MKKKKTTTSLPKRRKSNILKYLFLALIFIAPLNNGLFSETYFWPFAIITALVLLSVLKKQGEESKFGAIDILLIFLSVSYFLSFLGAASPRAAYLGVLKYIFYFACYFLTVYLWTEDEQDKEIVLLTMVSSITIGTVVTFLSQAQLLNFTNTVYGGRFASTIHYANTYATVLAAIIPLTVYLYYAVEKKLTKTLLLAAWFLNTVAFYATLSRGALLVYLPALLILIFCMEKEKRGFICGNLILLNSLAIAIAEVTLKNANAKILLPLLAGMTLVILLNSFVEKKKIKGSWYTAAVLLTLGIGGIVCIVCFPEKLSVLRITRLMDINIQVRGASDRLYFYEDAFKIFAQNWILGSGVGGWSALHKTVQGHLYDSTEVHSSLLQTMVENGVVGALFFLGIFVVLIVQQMYRIKHNKNTNLLKIVFLAVMVIFLHSLIDFDLTVPAVTMYLFVLIGLLDRHFVVPITKHKSSKIIAASRITVSLRIIAACLSVILLLSSLSLETALLISEPSRAFMKTGRIVGKASEIQKYERDLALAQKLDPLNPVYASYAGQLKVALGQARKTETKVEEGLLDLERAIKLEPYKYDAYLAKGQTLTQLNRCEEAAAYYEKIIELMPLQHTGYEYAIANYVKLALATGNKGYLQAARQIYQKAEEQMKKVAPERLRVWNYEHLDQSAFLNYNAGKAEFLAGDYAKGIEYFTLALKRATGTMRTETIAWLVVGQEKLKLPITVQADPQEIETVRSILQEFVVQSKGE